VPKSKAKNLSLFGDLHLAEGVSLERELQKQGYSLIAGVDEAGRGPLAGPVVAAAVILENPGGDGFSDPLSRQNNFSDDSKKMTPSQRERAFWVILKRARAVSVSLVDQGEIDRINILQATLKAMAQAVSDLDPQPDYVLIDGTQSVQTELPQQTVTHGDALVPAIGAASVVAKVFRDRLMVGYDRLYPGYGFARHKGYGTSAHLKALAELGPCRLHRLSFGPCASFGDGS